MFGWFNVAAALLAAEPVDEPLVAGEVGAGPRSRPAGQHGVVRGGLAHPADGDPLGDE
jgi:hypothetical protein